MIFKYYNKNKLQKQQ